MRRKKLLIGLNLVMMMLLSACGNTAEAVEEEIQETTATTETEVESKGGSEEESISSENENLEEDMTDTVVAEEALQIPDINYDDYIFDEEGNKILGYNIPEGYIVDEESSSKHIKRFLEEGTDNSPFEFWVNIPKTIEDLEEYTNGKEIHESELNDGTIRKYTIEEIQSVQTPYGEFQVFNKDNIEEKEGERLLDSVIAILPIDKERGIMVRYDTYFETEELNSYLPVYNGTMEDLLMDLFDEKEVEEKIEIPNNYEMYLENDNGEKLFGFNLPDEFQKSNSSYGESAYPGISFGNGSASLSIFEEKGMLSFVNTGKLVSWKEDNYTYEEKGIVDSLYGAIHLYDVTIKCTGYEYENGIEGEGKQVESTLDEEQAIVEINGHCIVISYSEYGDNKTNKIESIVKEMLTLD